MEEQEFIQIAERYERLALRNPRFYALRVAAMAVLGYVYILLALVVIGFLALVGGGLLFALRLVRLGAHLLFSQLGVALAVVRAMFVRVEASEGERVTRQQAPRLWDEVDQVRAALRARPVHRVLITPDDGAALSQYPRLGIFGWWRNELILGLATLEALRPDEARAVIAHELAHLSRNHARWAVWSYRTRMTWRRLGEALAREGGGGWLFRHFGDWYVPRFQAATLAVDRAHEREADRMAIQVAGGDAVARALTRTVVLSTAGHDELWPAFVGAAEEHPEPPCGWVSHLCRAARQDRGGPAGLARVEALMAEPANPLHTHPPLAERLRLAGVDRPPAAALQAVEHSASAELLGPLAATLMAAFDREWIEAAAPAWRERYETTGAQRKRLAELDARAALAPLTGDDALTHAWLVGRWRSADEAIPLLAALAPGRPAARLALGRLLLERGDAAGLRELDHAARQDRWLAPAAAELAAPWLDERGYHGDAAAWRQLGHNAWLEEGWTHSERVMLKAGERFSPLATPSARVEQIAQVLHAEPLVTRAWLVRRTLQHRPDYKPGLLVVQLRWPAILRKGVRLQLLQRIANAAAGDEMTVVAGHRHGLARRARRVPHSLVYDRRAYLRPAPLALAV